MASPLDELDRQHLVEIHRLVALLVKMLAKQQSQLSKLARTRTSDPNYRSRRYLRKLLSEQRTKLAQQKAYILQLENELRLHGLE